ncbi:hypothetical protein ACIQRS_08045 [Streptomyces termitum]|uniref:Uncharacterized protein n=1 Tax=Streptomyces termitum TaxID=67368 RepID=A0A918W525_9ACTN|nr:hypothetical protein [Streptomyces termitum]GHA65185.1 hypothetical protein GCM10010305_03520 [Streptomyces termitum]
MADRHDRHAGHDAYAGDGDDGLRDAERRAARAERIGWTAIAGVSGALGCALVAGAVLLVGFVVAAVWVVMAGNR